MSVLRRFQGELSQHLDARLCAADVVPRRSSSRGCVVTAELRAGESRHFAPKHQHLRFAHVRWATFSRIKPQFTNYPVGKTARAQVHPWLRSAHDQIQ
jgi:hypothetical protein